MATFTALYDVASIVYLRVADAPQKGMVTGVQFASGAKPLYRIAWAKGVESWHYEIELAREHVPDFVVQPEPEQ